MRLLHRKEDGSFEFTRDLPEETHASYGMLSHTWLINDDDEVDLDLMAQGSAETKPAGYRKIQFCADQAAKDGLEYFWVDTCCIDKKNSTELAEAINSMFRWYQHSTRCYVYLSDVSTINGRQEADWLNEFKGSRWFKRGWTLQELLAPLSVEFFSAEGELLGSKRSLEHCIHEITGIPLEALRGGSMTSFSVAERLSWTESRQTKRKEDKAYCLLGIFNIFLPAIYGEGDNAFTRLRNAIDEKYAEDARLDQVLLTLPVATEAAFNSRKNQHDPTCLPNTRLELLHGITNWADGADDRCIYWLNGIAGTGKSTVARTICRLYHDQDKLGASFFFSRGGGDLGNANKLITTLARQLATKIPSARRYICEAIMEQKDIADHSLRDQWDQLILSPLSKLKEDSPPTIILVLDALDECDSERDVRVVLRILSNARLLSNIRLRILITSRPDISIRYGFKKIPEAEREVFVLHGMSPELVDRDLGLFFENNFSAIREERGYEEDWPGVRIIRRLVEISCGLFIWASTACRFIREGKRFMKRRIDTLINGHRSGAGPEEQLDRIYTTVLKASIDPYLEKEKEELCDNLREVLGTIVVLSSPLSLDSLASLLNIPLSEVNDTLADLHTILHIPGQSSSPIRLHHPSFRDFLLDKNRCSGLDFEVGEKETHQAIAERCIVLMSKKLKRDICELKSPGTLVKDISAERIHQFISSELQYACLYWVEHIRQSGMRLTDNDRFHEFFRGCFLNWLEVMHLMGKSAEVGANIRLYHSLLEPMGNSRQITFAKDARRFFFAFQSIIKQAPLQTYCAALAFIPPTNELQRHFRSQMHPWIADIRIAEAIIPKAKDEFNYVNDLAFTPNGKQVASGSQLLAARLWDVASKRALYKFGDFEDKVSSVAISADGTMLAAGSDDFTVRVWSLETRKVRYSLKAHTRWVNSVVFSWDSKLLASGSMDETVALWDTATGRELKRFNNQSSCVNSATFSPDGSLVATGSVDQMIRLWDASNNSTEIRTMLDGHSGCVNSIKFSPDGQLVVSGSDDMTVKLWNLVIATELRTLTGHTKKVMAVTFSPDASLVVSGSEDKTVRVWDATSGSTLHVLESHKSGINAVVFSPDGQFLATGLFNDEVYICETNTWSPLGVLEDFEDGVDSMILQQAPVPASGDAMERINHEPETTADKELEGHSSTVTCVAFSSNGRVLATGSQDTVIKLWTRDGVENQKLEGHSATINHLIFSTDSHTLASSSADGSVKIWSCERGALVHTLEGHSDDVLLARFSPDAQLIASCSVDATARLWDTTTGVSRHNFTEHTGRVNDVAFSPNSQMVATCSVDSTVCLRNLATMEASKVLRGHSGPVNSIAFSPDGELLVSCSVDSSIRVWGKEGLPYRIIKDEAPQISCVTFSPNGQLLASSSASGTLTVWNLNSGLAKGSIETGVSIRNVSFSTCGRYIETDRGAIDARELVSPPSLPQTRPHALFVAQDWLRRDLQDVIWLPPEYHATSVANWGGAMVIGHSSGKLSFLYI